MRKLIESDKTYLFKHKKNNKKKKKVIIIIVIIRIH